jgi:hypothetical protein
VALLRLLGVAALPGVDDAALDRIAAVPVKGGDAAVGEVRAVVPL